MTYRQWMWGHANGVTVFAFGTFVWCSLGLGMAFTAERTAPQRSMT